MPSLAVVALAVTGEISRGVPVTMADVVEVLVTLVCIVSGTVVVEGIGVLGLVVVVDGVVVVTVVAVKAVVLLAAVVGWTTVVDDIAAVVVVAAEVAAERTVDAVLVKMVFLGVDEAVVTVVVV